MLLSLSLRYLLSISSFSKLRQLVIRSNFPRRNVEIPPFNEEIDILTKYEPARQNFTRVHINPLDSITSCVADNLIFKEGREKRDISHNHYRKCRGKIDENTW